ncbi:outer membrane beta-barrel protein [Flavihumibacter fluvii]|uniref:type IX secretion/gliding motility protein PorT/SprT n=1 Tax=Flavihumibacter fluvii TaxID=2838157 RepID=UPI001BDDCF6D|nr:outer membrane beta-barrel protein [Flavihumibacter fluvii]ULQ52610.1 PorT family protein [Flavihumibacter fluvii]
MYYILRNKITTYLVFSGILAFNLLGFSVTTNAQLRESIHLPDSDEKWYHIGIVIMGTSSRFQLSQHPRFLQYDSVLVSNPNNSFGFGLGGMHTFRINNRFEARAVFPQLLFVNKSINYHLSYPDASKEESEVMDQNVESILLGLPIQLKLKSDRIGNFRVYMMGGIKFETDLSSKANSRNAENFVKLKKLDFGIEAGIGFNFYNKMFILTPEIKISNGITNVHARDENLKFSNVIDKIQSRQIIFSLIFEG